MSYNQLVIVFMCWCYNRSISRVLPIVPMPLRLQVDTTTWDMCSFMKISQTLPSQFTTRYVYNVDVDGSIFCNKVFICSSQFETMYNCDLPLQVITIWQQHLQGLVQAMLEEVKASQQQKDASNHLLLSKETAGFTTTYTLGLPEHKTKGYVFDCNNVYRFDSL